MNSLIWIAVMLLWASGVVALANGQVALGTVALILVLGPLLAVIVAALMKSSAPSHHGRA